MTGSYVRIGIKKDCRWLSWNYFIYWFNGFYDNLTCTSHCFSIEKAGDKLVRKDFFTSHFAIFPGQYGNVVFDSEKNCIQRWKQNLWPSLYKTWMKRVIVSHAFQILIFDIFFCKKIRFLKKFLASAELETSWLKKYV